VGGLIAPAWADVGSGSLAAGPGADGQVGNPLLVALLAGGRLGLQLGLGLLQPGQPLGPAGQSSRQPITAGDAALAVLSLVDGRCLLEQLDDLGLEVGVGAVAVVAALASILVPSKATRPRRTMPAAAHSFSDWISRPARACS